jgi:non-haem Fe2+, alpha-ketoglutarate-dependent halogenase
MRNDYCFPIRILSSDEARTCLSQLEEYERQCGSSSSSPSSPFLSGDNRFKIHLLLPWAWDLVHHPIILKAVCGFLQSDDVWCWSTDVNVKEPNSDTHYTWHQDATYAGFSPPGSAVTVWLALSPSTKESGCLECIPNSNLKQLSHDEGIGGESNALSLGQQVSLEELSKLPLGKAVAMGLEPGEASLHGFWTVHASGPNTSSYRRIGLALRYVRADAIRTTRLCDFACQVSVAKVVTSNDTHRLLFEQETKPIIAMGQAERAHHAEATARERANYFATSSTISHY